MVPHQQVVLAGTGQNAGGSVEAQEGPQEVAMVVLEAQGIPATVLLVKFPVEVAAVPMVVQQQMEPEGNITITGSSCIVCLYSSCPGNLNTIAASGVCNAAVNYVATAQPEPWPDLVTYIIFRGNS